MSDELEYRAATLAAVSFPKRLIELIVMPYETETVVALRGKLITEICSRGAYDGIEARNDRVRVNRDHDITRTVGRAVRFHPSRQEGLVAEIRISETELGNETLVLADDGVLDASAGFMLLRQDGGKGPVYPDAEVWESRDRRRLNKLHLGHIGLTPEPAYETANVLAVRGGRPEPATVAATPNRDRLELERLQEMAAELDRRYGLTR
jgi:phage head maturation protease